MSLLRATKNNKTSILNLLLASSYIHQTTVMALSTKSHYEVCILGGGIGGCSALKFLLDTAPSSSIALIEMGRGLGGRSSTRLSREDERIQVNHGAPGADVHTIEGQEIMKSLKIKGFARQIDKSADQSAQYWVGSPNMSSLCDGLVNNLSSPKYLFQTMVRDIEPSLSNGKVTSWILKDKNDEIVLTTEWLVVSGSGVAHPRWTEAFGGEPPLIRAAKDITNKELNGALQAIGTIGAKPVQVAMMAFDATVGNWDSIGSETSIVETPDDDILEQLVFRKKSDGSLVTVVAHSSSEFALTAVDVYGSKSAAARIGGASSNKNREKEVLDMLMASVNAQLKKLIGHECLDPSFGPFLHRWGNAFPSGSALPLNQAVIGGAKVAFCGDYVGERFGTIEGALLSGMHVGKEVGRLIQDKLS